VPARDTFHEVGKARSLGAGVDNEMDMIGHQTKGVDAATEGLFPFFKVREVVPEVLGGEKDRLPVVTALDNMVRPVGQHQTSLPSHAAQSVRVAPSQSRK
jgi:hypothetical protein